MLLLPASVNSETETEIYLRLLHETSGHSCTTIESDRVTIVSGSGVQHDKSFEMMA